MSHHPIHLSTPKRFHHVAVVMGGLSAEREVSLDSGKKISETIRSLGYHVSEIDMDRTIAQQLTTLKPDIVFNALHGGYGENGSLPGLLDILDIPYTHSGVTASAIAMDKAKSKILFNQAGITCTGGSVYTYQTLLAALPTLEKPYVIKPVHEGSSVGVLIVHESDEHPAIDSIYPCKSYLVEPFVPGKELSVAVIDQEPLGVLELEPKSNFYDYAHKYTAGMTEHYMPARIDKQTYQLAMDMAYKAHTALDCSQISRSDFRFNPDSGKLYLMELNTHPGMTPLSIVPEIAAYRGISFQTLIQYLLENATCQK